MGPAFRLSDRPRRRATVSLTPLIDVVFILLVFFMLASSFIDWRVYDLSITGKGGGQGVEGAMLVELRRDDLRLSGQTLDLDQFEDILRARIDAKPEQRVVIKARDGADMQRLASLLDALSAVGVRNVALAEPEAAGAR